MEAMEDGNGGEAGLLAKNFVPRKDIKNFKDTANSWNAIGIEARHASTRKGSSSPKMTLTEAEDDLSRQPVRRLSRSYPAGWLVGLDPGRNVRPCSSNDLRSFSIFDLLSRLKDILGVSFHSLM